MNYYGFQQPALNPVPDLLNAFKSPYQPQAQAQSGILWVQGEQAAKSFPVAAGSTVVLWDSENPLIHVKSVDGAGLPNMRTFEIKERTETKTEIPKTEFVGKEDFRALQERVEALAEKIEKGVTENG